MQRGSHGPPGSGVNIRDKTRKHHILLAARATGGALEGKPRRMLLLACSSFRIGCPLAPSVDVLGQIVHHLLILRRVAGQNIADGDQAEQGLIACDRQVADPVLLHDRFNLI
jgi:hypothetical protein